LLSRKRRKVVLVVCSLLMLLFFKPKAHVSIGMRLNLMLWGYACFSFGHLWSTCVQYLAVAFLWGSFFALFDFCLLLWIYPPLWRSWIYCETVFFALFGENCFLIVFINLMSGRWFAYRSYLVGCAVYHSFPCLLLESFSGVVELGDLVVVELVVIQLWRIFLSVGRTQQFGSQLLIMNETE